MSKNAKPISVRIVTMHTEEESINIEIQPITDLFKIPTTTQFDSTYITLSREHFEQLHKEISLLLAIPKKEK